MHMKRLLLLVLTSLLILTLTAPAAAVPPTDLTALAAYFPDKTPVFAAVRTDDGFINDLDVVLEQLRIVMPDADIPESLMDAFDEMVGEQYEGADFQSVFRPWLGDTAALGVISLATAFDDKPQNDDETPMMFAVSITDRAAAEAWFQETSVANNPDDFEVLQTADYTLVTRPSDPNSSEALLFRDDAVFFTNQPALLPTDGLPPSSLAANPDFASTLALLPESDYNAAIYVDQRVILAGALASAEAEAEDEMEESVLDMIEELSASAAPQVVGFTMLNDRALVIDSVQSMDAAALARAASQPVDLAFAGYIPRGTPLVIHASNLEGLYNAAIDQLRDAAALETDDDDFEPEDLEQVLAQIGFLVRGATGLELEEEILSWMDGDFALTLDFDPALTDIPAGADPMDVLFSRFPFDFGVLIATSSPTQSAAFVSGLQESLTGLADETMTVSTETIGGANVVVITVEDDDMPFPFELLLGSNDTLFAFGTRKAVTGAFNPTEGLVADASFIEAQATMLANPFTVLYLNGPRTLPLATIAELSGDEEDAEDLAALLRLMHSASITTAAIDGGYAARIVMTLPE